ncbi:IS110 family transposase [Mucilaginibacter sp.]|uniref:IS110 family transposase n=1 Tax=Mucilaginibacter sp. TaxID=1882438 RepID=UPI00262ED935|nr:IS110 family transposase [Mucilaginibacter sp.]MDB4922037.1 family transposase [Mucilaginibacter sp.]
MVNNTSITAEKGQPYPDQDVNQISQNGWPVEGLEKRELKERLPARRKKFTYFIGIDVSKDKLDYAVFCRKDLLFHQVAANEPDAILEFVNELKGIKSFSIKKALFCMEATGIYCNHLLTILDRLQANIAMENPYHISRSFGLVREKTDKSDAIRIADYAQKNGEDLKLWVARRPVLQHLKNLSTLRARLLTAFNALSTPLGEQKRFAKKDIQTQAVEMSAGSIKAIKSDLSGVNKAIEKLIRDDDRLKRLNQLITSVPGVGMITAIQIILATNEFNSINNPKKFACYAGVAPFKKESGTGRHRHRVSQMANKKIKTLLHMCAIAAIIRHEEFTSYYARRTKDNGKPKMAVINAIKNKLILRIFACVNQNRVYRKNYQNQNDTNAGGSHFVPCLERCD